MFKNVLKEEDWVNLEPKKPIEVSVVGTTLGNELQNRILTGILVTNLLMFYLCTLATLRWLFQGN